MEKLNNLYNRFKLGLLFLGVPVIFFVLGYVLNSEYHYINPFHIMAYSMQIGAFIVFIRRVNLIYIFNNPKDKSIWEAIKISISPPLTGESIAVTEIKAHGRGYATGFTQPESKKVGDIEKMLIAHDKRLNNLESTVHKLPYEMDKKDRELKKKLLKEIEAIKDEKEDEEQKKADFNIDNVGPEFVAVLWLLIAAYTIAVSHMWG